MKKWEGQLFLFFAFSLAGTGVIFARLASGRLGPFTIGAAGLFFALLLLIPLSGKRLTEGIRTLTGKGLFFLVTQALFGIFLFRLFLLLGLAQTSSMEAGIITGATPAITAVLAALVLKEKVGAARLWGIGCTVAGILFLQGEWGTQGLSLTHLGGNLLVLMSAACESVFNILSRVYAIQAGQKGGKALPPLVQTTLVSLFAFILCLIPALFEKPFQRLGQANPTEWTALVCYGVFVTALAFIFWYAGIKRSSAFTAAAYSGMMPLTSMLLSVGILGEKAGWQEVLGGLLVISGMLIIGMKGKEAHVITAES